MTATTTNAQIPSTLTYDVHCQPLVRYWSVFEQRWCTRYDVPARELAAMSEEEREQVMAHLGFE